MIAYPSRFLCLLMLSVGGQKRRCNDVVVSSKLKQCNLLKSWKKKAEGRNSWRSIIKSRAKHFNKEAEDKEKSLRDDRKPWCEQFIKSCLKSHLRSVYIRDLEKSQVQVTVITSYGTISLSKKLTHICFSRLRSINEYLVIDWGPKRPSSVM